MSPYLGFILGSLAFALLLVLCELELYLYETQLDRWAEAKERHRFNPTQLNLYRWLWHAFWCDLFRPWTWREFRDHWKRHMSSSEPL